MKICKLLLAIFLFVVVVTFPDIVAAATDTSGIKSKFQDMADTVFDVARYIGIYGGLGGAIVSLLFRYINKDQNIWSDALKILGAGAGLAAFSTILSIIAGWI
ncbi:hypothetical protein J5681_06800 [bacterium]|nr:hypothetical protein [bacterium]